MITRLIKSFAAQGLNYSIDLIKTILLVPFFISNWGLESYGSYLTTLSFLALLMSIDNGFGLYVSNNYNLLFHNDEFKAKKQISSAFKALILSNTIQTIFVLLFTLIQLNFYFFPADIDVFYALLVLCIYRLFFGSLKGLLVKTLFPIGYYHRSSIIGSTEKIVEILVLIPFVIYSDSFLDAIIYISIFKSVYCLISIYLIKRWTKLSSTILIKNGNIRKGLNMYKKSIPLMFNSFFDKSTNDGIISIISITLGPSLIPIFTTTKTLSNILLKLINLIIFHPFIPEFGRLHSINQYNKIKKIIKLLLSLIIISFLPMLYFVMYSEYIYNYWMNYELKFNSMLFSTLISSSFLYLISKIFVSYFVSINNVKSLTIFSFVRGIGILLLGYYITTFFGINGLGLSNLIAETVSFGLIFYLTYKFFSKRIQLFSKKEIFLYATNTFLVFIGIFSATYIKNLFLISIISLTILIFNFQTFNQIYILLTKNINDKN